MLHTIDAICLSSMLLLLKLLGFLLAMLLQVLGLLVPKFLLLLECLKDILTFYIFRVIRADSLVFELSPFLTRYQLVVEKPLKRKAERSRRVLRSKSVECLTL